MWERIRVENASPRTLVTDVAVRVTTDQRSVNEVRAGENVSPVPLVFRRGPAALSWDAGSGAAIVVAAPHGHHWERVRVTDFRLTRLVAQSLADAEGLRMATTSSRDDAFLAAGSPWYVTLFGRDSLWSARLLLPFGWELAAGTLRTLAAFQGRRHEAASREDPGKVPGYRPPAAGRILHELRAEGSTPPTCYDSQDATPLWVCLLHDAWRRGMPDAQVEALLPNLQAALGWLRDHADSDGDGLLEPADTGWPSSIGSGWRDAWDSVMWPDGGLAQPPIALCEVQGYAHEAAMNGADLLEAFGEDGGEWRAWAARLSHRFRESFWVEDDLGPFPALAVEGHKYPVPTACSTIGHLLGTGLLTAEEEAQVAARLAGPHMDSGFGLRTVSPHSLPYAYDPHHYHNGAVWPHDTAIVALGLDRAGYLHQARSLAEGLLEAASSFGWRLPEVYAGVPRSQTPHPLPYKDACSPQAWAAAACGALVEVLS